MKKTLILLTLLLSFLLPTFSYANSAKKYTYDDINGLTKKANQGDPIAQITLGFIYQSGKGVKQSDSKAEIQIFDC